MIEILLVICIVMGLGLFLTRLKSKSGVDLSMKMDVYPKDDSGYIKHMINHHQVAVDMSKHLLKYTTNPRMMALCRDIIWAQKFEIWQMRNMLKSMEFSSPLMKPREKNFPETPLLEKYYPQMSQA